MCIYFYAQIVGSLDAISEIEIIKEETREVNLNADRKRFWLGRIESMDDEMMNESVPLSLNYFKLEINEN